MSYAASQTSLRRQPGFGVERVPEGGQREQEEVFVRLAARLKQNLSPGIRRRHLFKKYANCFSGMEAVDWMLEFMEAKSVAEAVRKGQALYQRGFLSKVDKEVKFEYSNKRFFQFTHTTPEFKGGDTENDGPEYPIGSTTSSTMLELPLSAVARRRALAAILGGFVADAASTALNGVSKPEKSIPNLLRLDFDPAFCGARDSISDDGNPSLQNKMESSTGFETRILLSCIARRGEIHGAQLAKDAYWGFKKDQRMLSTTTRAFVKRVRGGRNWPHCAVKCKSIDVLSILPVVVALYAGTNSLFPKVDELVRVFYAGQRVRDAALIAAFVLEQIILGASVLQAMRMSIRTERLSVKQRKSVFKAFTKSQLPSYEAIQHFGNKGALPSGFYAVLQPLFVLSDYQTAVRENIIGGGRTCRRAMFIGACFAAQDGAAAIPAVWSKRTQHLQQVEADAQAILARREIPGSNSFKEDGVDERTTMHLTISSGSNIQQVNNYDNSVHLASSEPSHSVLGRQSATNVRQSGSSTRSTMSNSRLPQRQWSGSYQRKMSIDSGASSPRSQASNYSYATVRTSTSSANSVIDLGDMEAFYEDAISVSSAPSGSQSTSNSYGMEKRSSGEQYQFFQSYGAGTSRHSDNSRRTSVSRGSDQNPLRTSDYNPFYQSTLTDPGRRKSGEKGLNNSDYRGRSSVSSGYGSLNRSRDLDHQTDEARASDSQTFRRSSTYVTDEEEDDVVLAHRVSLGHEARMSLHAIL